MKISISLYVFFFAFLLTSSLKAQTVLQSKLQASTTDSITLTNVKVLTNYKATKQQKKVIRKIKKYVTAHFFGRKVRTEGLIGKTVKVQLTINDIGMLRTVLIIKGQGPKIDKRVLELIKKYNQKKPIGNTKIKKPATIQITIPLVNKRYFLD